MIVKKYRYGGVFRSMHRIDRSLLRKMWGDETPASVIALALETTTASVYSCAYKMKLKPRRYKAQRTLK